MNKKPAHYFTSSQEARFLSLAPSAQAVLLRIIAILQDAELNGHLTGHEFIDMIDALIVEARERREYYREFLPT